MAVNMTPAELRALADRIESEECTGIAAGWCPVHGSCTCPQNRARVRGAAMNHLHREAWREAVRSGDLDRPHPGGCWCRECAREEAGE